METKNGKSVASIIAALEQANNKDRQFLDRVQAGPLDQGHLPHQLAVNVAGVVTGRLEAISLLKELPDAWITGGS